MADASINHTNVNMPTPRETSLVAGSSVPCSFSCDASDAGDAYWRSYVGVMPAWTHGRIPEYQKMAHSWLQSLSLRNALSQRPSGFKFVPACSSNFHMDTCYCRIAWFASWCTIASGHLSSETAPLPCCPTASPMQVITMGNLAVDWLKLSPTSTCHHRGILKLRNASPICSLLSGSHQSGYSVWRNLSEGKRFTMKPIKIQCKAWISKSNTQHSVCARYCLLSTLHSEMHVVKSRLRHTRTKVVVFCLVCMTRGRGSRISSMPVRCVS